MTRLPCLRRKIDCFLAVRRGSRRSEVYRKSAAYNSPLFFKKRQGVTHNKIQPLRLFRGDTNQGSGDQNVVESLSWLVDELFRRKVGIVNQTPLFF